MNKYNENVRCPKCDNYYITTRFNGSTNKLVRVCGRCGYWWYEEPLDINKKDKK